MNDTEKLIIEYRELAIRHGEKSINGDYKTANKSYDKLQKIFKKLVSIGEDKKLVKLLTDTNKWVQCWAAAHCLEINESEALKVLKFLEEESIPHVSVNAKCTIQEWKKGKIKFRT